MPFLPPNQRRRSTEGSALTLFLHLPENVKGMKLKQLQSLCQSIGSHF